MTIGTLVRETETDPNWQMHPGVDGVVVACADEEMGLPGCGRFWMVRFVDESGAFEDSIFLDTDLMVVS
jgi:hypothetical protein